MRMTQGIGLVFLLLATMAGTALGADKEAQYLKDIETFFQDSTAVLEEVLEQDLPPEDVAVCYFLARESGATAQQLAKLHGRGDSWMEIMKSRGLGPGTLYFRINVAFDSKVYSPIFEKFTSTPESEWASIALTDEEVLNLVNLRVIYRRHGFSVFEVMAMRDFGKSFSTINEQIAALRAKRETEEKQKERAAKAKAKAEAGD